jgi:Uma2 family endonuclease
MTPAVSVPPPAQPFTLPSGTPPVPPTQPSAWAPVRWTLRDYRKLGSLDLFQDVKVMLIKGEIFTMPAPKPPHDEGLSLTQEFLRGAFSIGHFVRNQQALDVGRDSDPLPDLAVVAGSIRDLHGRMPSTAVMVVEIADTSLFLDTTTKAELYATAGVPEYWVLDVANRQLHVFRDPVPLPEGLGATAYRTHTAHDEAATVAPRAAPSATVRVADLLP